MALKMGTAADLLRHHCPMTTEETANAIARAFRACGDGPKEWQRGKIDPTCSTASRSVWITGRGPR